MANDATSHVSLWICNDGDYYHEAKRIMQADGVDALARYLTRVLTTAARDSAAGYTRYHLSGSDFDTIDWHDIAQDLE